MAVTPKLPETSNEKSFETLNGSESLAHERAAHEAYQKGNPLQGIKEGFNALVSSMKYETGASEASYEKTFETLNGPEAVAFAKSATNAFEKGDNVGYLRNDLKAEAASIRYEAGAVADGVKALFTPGTNTGKERDGR
jgi:hypothetical protein